MCRKKSTCSDLVEIAFDIFVPVKVLSTRYYKIRNIFGCYIDIFHNQRFFSSASAKRMLTNPPIYMQMKWRHNSDSIKDCL